MRVLVSGANGFTGSHLVDRLLAAGHDVGCFVRPRSNHRWLEGKPVTLIECDDIFDRDAVRRAVAGREQVFHVLGTLVASNLEQYRRINVQPVRLFLEACAGEPNLHRFVFIGSHGAAGPNPASVERMTEEDTCRPVSDYGRSKLEAEDVVREYTGQVPWTILRPSAMYGPRDVNLLKIFQSACRGRLIEPGSYPNKAFNLTHVQDVVEGIYLASASDTAREQTYFLAGEHENSFREIHAAFEKALGRKIKHSRVPDFVIKLLMLRADIMSRFFKRDILLNRDRLATLTAPRWVCDIAKAQQQLGFQPRISLDEGTAETLEWYRREGWIGK